MFKTLVCGDLHTKFNILELVKRNADKFDRIIFLGDYVDDWNAPAEASYNLLSALVEWKKQEPDKVILLWGNHDLSEYLGREFQCSGYNKYTASLLRPVFSQNLDCFQVAYEQYGILFSHAGLTQGWLQDVNLGSRLFDFSELAKCLNSIFEVVEGNRRLNCLASAGRARGGWNEPSPLWADKSELENGYPRGLVQVVGHTPVSTITMHFENKTRGEGIIFCDTHSTYQNGQKVGDNSFLQITHREEECDTGRFWLEQTEGFEKIYLN